MQFLVIHVFVFAFFLLNPSSGSLRCLSLVMSYPTYMWKLRYHLTWLKIASAFVIIPSFAVSSVLHLSTIILIYLPSFPMQSVPSSSSGPLPKAWELKGACGVILAVPSTVSCPTEISDVMHGICWRQCGPRHCHVDHSLSVHHLFVSLHLEVLQNLCRDILHHFRRPDTVWISSPNLA